MDINENPTLSYALDLWCDYMRNEFSELRPLWFPSESICMQGGWSRSDGAWEDLKESCEQRIVVIVNRVVGDMSPAMRSALEASIGLLDVSRVRNQKEMAAEAKARVWRALLSEGCGQ